MMKQQQVTQLDYRTQRRGRVGQLRLRLGRSHALESGQLDRVYVIFYSSYSKFRESGPN
jgi:hypothetical protein